MGAQTDAKTEHADPAKSAFAGALISAGPAVELGSAVSTYDWLIGVWDAQLIDFLDDGSRHEQRGEWHFSWNEAHGSGPFEPNAFAVLALHLC